MGEHKMNEKQGLSPVVHVLRASKLERWVLFQFWSQLSTETHGDRQQTMRLWDALNFDEIESLTKRNLPLHELGTDRTGWELHDILVDYLLEKLAGKCPATSAGISFHVTLARLYEQLKGLKLGSG